MNLTSIGDMSFNLMQRTRSAALKSTMNTLTQELTTGRVSDVAARLGSDFSYLSDIDYNLSRLGGYAVSATEASLFTSASQLNLGQIQDVVSGLGLELLTLNPATVEAARRQIGANARVGLDTIVGAMNGSAGGRSLFAGISTDTSPMASPGTLIDALKVEVAGLTLASDILQAIDDWFAVGGGFRATMYSGSDQTLAPIQVGVNEQVALSLLADAPEFRSVLRNTAVAALATDPDLALGNDTQNTLLSAASQGMLKNDNDLTGLRADLGYAQARIEEASSRNAAARTGFEYARAELLAADPFETASRLEEVQFQLESLYAVTVRTSRLTLLSFL